jgi:cellulose synthase operon protein C
VMEIIMYAFKKSLVIFVGALLLVSLPATPLHAATKSGYTYQTEDKKAQQKKYISQLEGDKKKAELAIRNTKALIDKSRSKPYLPELYLRLAELYIEKSRIVYFLRKGLRDGELSSLDKFETNMLKNKAIEIYQRILDHFPEFADLDKVHFFMAHEYRELNQLDKMVAQYRAILKDFPNSKYVPESHLLLGDYAIGKEDIEIAKRHYSAVLEQPECPAAGIARYKLAWCEINNAEFGKAMALFEAAVNNSKTGQEVDIDTYSHVDVRLESLIDMAYCYPERYKKADPKAALAYFRKYAWSRQAYTTVLDKLANRYFIKKQWTSAADIYRELARLRNDPEKLLEYSRNIFECVQVLGSYKDADKDVQLIVHALRQQKYDSQIDPSVKKKNFKDYELYARDIITHLHKKAREKKDADSFKIAADAYDIYLDFFTESPKYKEMQANYAEALFASRQYLKAGKQYEAIIAEAKRGSRERKERLYSSVTSYYQALKEHKKELNYYDLAYARDGLRTTGKQYAKAWPKSRYTPDVLFNVAWVAYDSGDYDTAIKEYTQFIDTYPGSKSTNAAAHLVLDAYLVKEDYQNMRAFGQKLLANARIKDAKLRADVSEVMHNAESQIVSSMTLAAVDDWAKGKKDLMQIAEESKTSGLGEQALNALIASSKEKSDLPTLFDASANLVRRYPKSQRVPDTLNLMIDTSLKIGQYRLLADYLEEYANLLPEDNNTRDFLAQAGQIRDILGQGKLSSADYKRYLNRNPGDQTQREEAIFTLAQNARESGDAHAAIKMLFDHRKMLSDAGQVRADASVAVLYAQTGQYKNAASQLKKAQKKYSKAIGKSSSEARDAVAAATYATIQPLQKQYQDLQLGKKLDNGVVKKKSKLLTNLEQQYQNVINYQSPDWALKACFQMAQINDEFARFLLEAPSPKLAPEQKKQYRTLVAQKADGYRKKADQYRQTSAALATKWEVCDPDLSAYTQVKSGSATASVGSFSARRSDKALELETLDDQVLKPLHNELLHKPETRRIRLRLAEVYLQRGDFAQALLAAQYALQKTPKSDKKMRASCLNTIGVCRLYLGEDRLAHQEFKEAVSIDKQQVAAKINLAGLLKHYGYNAKAQSLLVGVNAPQGSDPDMGVIHPRAGELFYVSKKVSQKSQ